MTDRVSEKNLREMHPDRDFTLGTPIVKRYCILSTPRSGSTLLGRMLFATGMAGDPLEYFNPPLLAIERDETGIADMNLNQFLLRMQHRRTSPNGFFGMKLHYSQMLYGFNSRKINQQMVDFLRNFAALIWIRRRDRVSQAISLTIAKRTGLWSTEDSKLVETDERSIHPSDCLDSLHVVASDDYSWQQFLQATKLPTLETWYENLVDDYEAESRRILKYLNLNGAVESVPRIQLKRQAGALNQQLYKDLLSYLDLSELSK